MVAKTGLSTAKPLFFEEFFFRFFFSHFGEGFDAADFLNFQNVKNVKKKGFFFGKATSYF